MPAKGRLAFEEDTGHRIRLLLKRDGKRQVRRTESQPDHVIDFRLDDSHRTPLIMNSRRRPRPGVSPRRSWLRAPADPFPDARTGSRVREFSLARTASIYARIRICWPLR